jgi:hypothetical protein
MPNFADYDIKAGIAAVDLITAPNSWIHRRVETVSMLTHEETRRQVSVDFTLSLDAEEELTTEDGVVIPISVLSKEARRNFDLRDESSAAVPVLGKESNGRLSHVTALAAILDLLPEDLSDDAFELLSADVGLIVNRPPDGAIEALSVLAGGAESGNDIRRKIWDSDLCRELLETLSTNYVLFAVLPPGGPRRRILKYSYSDGSETAGHKGSLRERLDPWWLLLRAVSPDRHRFYVPCPAAHRAASFHVEIEIPPDLRIETAVLYDFGSDKPVSASDENVNRASLYASPALTTDADVKAYVEVVAERRGKPSLAATTGMAVTALLWLGVHSGLQSENPGPAISILLAGAALFSGLSAVSGEHSMVTYLFKAPKRWLTVIAGAALVASATLAFEVPKPNPVAEWRIAAILTSVATVRLIWSAVRSPR